MKIIENYKIKVAITQISHLEKESDTLAVQTVSCTNQLLQLRTSRTAWSDSDQAVRAVHCCNSW